MEPFTFTKTGGYPSYIQSPISLKEYQYVMQIASEDKPRFMIGDNGNLYLYRSRTDGSGTCTGTVIRDREVCEVKA